MSGILRSAFLRASRLSTKSGQRYGSGEVMELTGRPPKLYVGVEKAPTLPAWVSNTGKKDMIIESLRKFTNGNINTNVKYLFKSRVILSGGIKPFRTRGAEVVN